VAVSRILSFAEATGRPFLSLRLRATPRFRGVRLIPGMCPACAGRPGRAVIPVLSCTARGLSCRDDHSPRGGLLPRHFNLTRRGGRYIFCDTIRGGGLASVGPALARGVLPRGVRTFLCAGEPRSGRRPPAVRKLCPANDFRNRGLPSLFVASVCDRRCLVALQAPALAERRYIPHSSFPLKPQPFPSLPPTARVP